MNDFSETVTIPMKGILVATLPTATFGTGILYWMSEPFLGSRVFETDWVLLGQITILTFPLVALSIWLSKWTTIKVSTKMQFSGIRGATLMIRGGPRASRTFIPLESVQQVEVVHYESKLWHSSVLKEKNRGTSGRQPTFWQSFFALRYDGDEVPTGDLPVPGYEGPGLLVSCRAKSITSQEEHLWKIQFPTRDAETLRRLLEAS